VFIFDGYQGLRFTTADGEAANSIATPLRRSGDLSELLLPQYAGSKLDWNTGTPNQQVTGCNITKPDPNGTIYDPTSFTQFGFDACVLMEQCR